MGGRMPDVDGLRVVRGGSWYTDRDTVRCAYRDWDDPWHWNNDNGFRLARTSLLAFVFCPLSAVP